MTSPVDEKDAKDYAHLSSSDVKDQLIKHYLLHFCSIKDSLPEIDIIYLVNNEKGAWTNHNR